ncbi:MAG TPA: cyanophycinase [Gemmatimonadaceae bacterium]|jgi:cyanophycinase|nr:cyanophycinase [Gemmatimonadaceae bacterium]
MSARPDGNQSAAGAARRREDEHAGSLVLIGGACTATGDALGTFLDLASARDGGLIVGFTTASVDPGSSAMAWKDDFARAGARNVEFPIVDRRARAQDPRIAELVLRAKGIFLGGGDQVTLISTLGGSRVWRAIREAYAGGAIVGGTSAGAAALSETVLAGGEIDETGEPVALHLGSGLGLLGFSSVVDTHFSKRGRLQRLFRQVAENPELLGLGIDEDTAMVVNGHRGHVVGNGSVTYVDGRGVRFDNAEDVAKRGVPLTLSYLRVGIIGAGYTFDLRERELELLVDESREAVETPIVK